MKLCYTDNISFREITILIFIKYNSYIVIVFQFLYIIFNQEILVKMFSPWKRGRFVPFVERHLKRLTTDKEANTFIHILMDYT
jgi:hypothetical protein